MRLAQRSPDFAERASAAQRGYSGQRAAARRAVADLSRERCKWLRRPDVGKVWAAPRCRGHGHGVEEPLDHCQAQCFSARLLLVNGPDQML